jgi:heptaprenyl diphosphate synthase
MKLFDLFARLRKDMSTIENSLEHSISSDHRVLHHSAVHLLKAGGKRIRPIFVLLAGEFGTYDINQLEKVAVPLELIHMSSLVHDDVIDNAETRRGEQTVKSKWDNRTAMYTGDYIFGRALSIITELKDERIHQVLANAIVQMCIGEMEQIRLFFQTEQSIYDYLLRIRRKTALLIAISCQLGAIATGCDRKTINQLYRYGYNVGMCFQIKDDLLDLLGKEEEIGKPPGSDIRQGNITIPVLYALQDEKLREPLLNGIQQIRDNPKEADIEGVLAMIRNSDGIRKAEQLSERYIEKAIAAIEQLPAIKAKSNLIDIAKFVAYRNN